MFYALNKSKKNVLSSVLKTLYLAEMKFEIKMLHALNKIK